MYVPKQADIDKALASLAKAYPVLVEHASCIDGEFDNALTNVRRMICALQELVPEKPAEGAVCTERDLVLAKREGWVACDREFSRGNDVDLKASRREAAKRYPLPKVTRSRLVRVGDKEYRLDAGRIQFRVPCDGASWCDHAEWRECQVWQPSPRTPVEVKVLSNLLEHPTEEVDDPEDACTTR